MSETCQYFFRLTTAHELFRSLELFWQQQQEPAPNPLRCLFSHEYLAHLSFKINIPTTTTWIGISWKYCCNYFHPKHLGWQWLDNPNSKSGSAVLRGNSNSCHLHNTKNFHSPPYIFWKAKPEVSFKQPKLASPSYGLFWQFQLPTSHWVDNNTKCKGNNVTVYEVDHLKPYRRSNMHVQGHIKSVLFVASRISWHKSLPQLKSKKEWLQKNDAIWVFGSLPLSGMPWKPGRIAWPSSRSFSCWKYTVKQRSY